MSLVRIANLCTFAINRGLVLDGTFHGARYAAMLTVSIGRSDDEGRRSRLYRLRAAHPTFLSGPCSIVDGEGEGNLTTKRNPYSWNEKANIFFLDEPIDGTLSVLSTFDEESWAD